jgi:hypothetical protein
MILTRNQGLIHRAFWSIESTCEYSATPFETSIRDMSEVSHTTLLELGPRVVIMGDELNISLKTENIVRERLDEKHGSFALNYVRWFGRANTDLVGFTEFMQILQT